MLIFLLVYILAPSLVFAADPKSVPPPTKWLELPSLEGRREDSARKLLSERVTFKLRL